jgi:hypothetical protein
MSSPRETRESVCKVNSFQSIDDAIQNKRYLADALQSNKYNNLLALTC